MTKILSLDTSTSACSVALYHDGNITRRFVATPREHTRLLLPMVDSLLDESGISLSQLDALAFTAGPGSFTGLRIGFGVIQGLAFGADLPVIPISTLAALALTGARKTGLDSGCILPALDARMSEIYWGLYRYDAGAVDALMADQVSRPQYVAHLDMDIPHLGVGDGWRHLAPDFSAIQIDVALTPDADSVAELALAKFIRGDACAVEKVELAYIRNDVSWTKRTKIRQT